MPSHPPPTKFYKDSLDNYTLWRDISRKFEDFVGEDEAKWAERREQFVTVLNDVLVRLNDSKGDA